MGKPEELFKEMCAYFDSEGIKYLVMNEEDNLVRLMFAGREWKDGGGVDTKLFVDFDEMAEQDGSVTVHFASIDIARCTDNNIAEALVRINALNKGYRWVKFWFDERNNSFNADADAIVFEGTVGKECTHYAFRMSSIVEDALLEMKDIFTPVDDSDLPSKDELLAMLEALRSMLDEDAE
ncbi:MAG: hypothetical protein Q4D39_00085 [Coriobacteriaceae bacterium]|nr:hypothetical protein [Coriobacteriaceae bacterium]